MRWFLLAGLLFACGGSTLGGPCSKTCDCPNDSKPLSCSGEWVCNANSTCEYTCKNTCATLPYTCGVNDTCNAAKLCSERAACP
jgi:hypothetical protein